MDVALMDCALTARQNGSMHVLAWLILVMLIIAAVWAFRNWEILIVIAVAMIEARRR